MKSFSSITDLIPSLLLFSLLFFSFLSFFRDLILLACFPSSFAFLFLLELHSSTFVEEQKYTDTGLSLLELPKKHVHNVLITFEEAEAEAYKKLEMYFAEQYTVCKESSANGVRDV